MFKIPLFMFSKCYTFEHTLSRNQKGETPYKICIVYKYISISCSFRTLNKWMPKAALFMIFKTCEQPQCPSGAGYGGACLGHKQHRQDKRTMYVIQHSYYSDPKINATGKHGGTERSGRIPRRRFCAIWSRVYDVLEKVKWRKHSKTRGWRGSGQAMHRWSMEGF